MQRRKITALLALILVAGFLSGCHKNKDKSTVASSGKSTLSLVTLKGASQ